MVALTKQALSGVGPSVQENGPPFVRAVKNAAAHMRGHGPAAITPAQAQGLSREAQIALGVGAGAAAATAAVAATSREDQGSPVLNGALRVTDAAAGVIGTSAMAVNIGTLPLMLAPMVGGLGVGALGGVSKLAGWQGGMKAAEKGGNFLGRMTEYSLKDFGSVVDRIAGKNTSSKLVKLTGMGGALNTYIPTDPHLRKEFLENAPLKQKMMHGGLLHNAMQTAWGASIGVSMYGVARDSMHKTHALTQLENEIRTIEGRTDFVTDASVLTATLSKPATALRKQYMLHNGIHAVAETAGMVMFLKQNALNKRLGAGMLGNLIGMAAFMLPDQIASIAGGFIGESPLPHFAVLHEMSKSGNPLPPEGYAQLIYSATKEMQKLEPETAMQVAMIMGAEYANKKTPPAQILIDAYDGTTAKQINEVIAKEQAAAKAAQATQAAQTSQPMSAVERLMQQKNAGPKIVQPKPEVGTHTQLLNKQQAAIATPGVPTPG